MPAYAPVIPGKLAYAEWYWHAMTKGAQSQSTRHWTGTWDFHQKMYGADFPYQDFAPQFHAELFDPDHWADVSQRSGAKYVALTSKHHEGFALWPSKEAWKTWGRPWNHYIYADILKPEFFMLRIGLFKKPFSLEALYSTRYLWMVNRSLGAINYQNLLDIGIGAHGSFLKDSVEYGIGLFNGNGRNLENNPHKLVCGRIVWRPWITQDDSPFRKLQFGASFSTSQKFSTPSSFATGSGTTFLSWNSSKTRAKTQKSLAGADIEWLNGPSRIARGIFNRRLGQSYKPKSIRTFYGL